MVLQAILVFSALLGTFVPLVLCSSPESQQTVLAVSPIDDAGATKDLPRSFNPRNYGSHQHMARCPGINRSTPEASLTELQLQYVHIVNPEASRTLLLVHGWPSLWSTWSNQILHFNSSYSLLIPNLRGFGASTHPGDVQTSGNMPDLVGDLACIMGDAKVESVACVGHDWGSQVCWEMARSRPDLVEAVAGAVLPYMPSVGEFQPIDDVVPLLPRLAYQVYFAGQTKTAVTELNASIRRSLRSVFRTVDSPPPSEFLTSDADFLGAWREFSELPPSPFFTQEEEDYVVEQYALQGFEYTLEFYTTQNRIASFDAAHAQGNFTIPQPALSILPTRDPVADWSVVAKLLDSASHIPHLTTVTIPAQHWPQLEKPQEFNEILENWLKNLPPREADDRVRSSRTEGEL